VNLSMRVEGKPLEVRALRGLGRIELDCRHC
jgi:hypothetical protein